MRSSILNLVAGSGLVLVLVHGFCSARPFVFRQVYASSPSAQASQSPPISPPAGIRPPVSAARARRDAWECLTGGLVEKDDDRRASAISALGTIGVRPDVVQLIENGLDDKSPSVRQVAAATLGRVKSRSSIPKLRAALEDDSPLVYYAAATALWQMNDKRGEEILVEIVQGDRKISRGTVGEGLHYAHTKLHDPAQLAELGAEQAAGSFFGPAGWGVTLVVGLAKDKGAATRAASALLLGDSNDAVSRDSLEHALEDKSWIVRAAAAEALARHGSHNNIAMLAPLLKDEHPEVRYEAAAAILRLTPRHRP
jgi:HEAT repeat protein